MDSIQSLDHVRPFNSVGEIGCGTGRFFEVFKKHYPGAVVDVFDKNVHYMDYMRSKFGDQIQHYYTGNAIYLQKLIGDDKKYDLIIVQGVAQYWTDEELRTFLKNARNALNLGGTILLKEQYSETTKYLSASKDWMRSIGCFLSAFKASLFDAYLVSEYRHAEDYHFYLTFVLEPSTKPKKGPAIPVFVNRIQKQFDDYERMHLDCFGETKGQPLQTKLTRFFAKK